MHHTYAIPEDKFEESKYENYKIPQEYKQEEIKEAHHQEMGNSYWAGQKKKGMRINTKTLAKFN